MLWCSHRLHSSWRAEPEGQSFLLRPEAIWNGAITWVLTTLFSFSCLQLVSFLRLGYVLSDKNQNELIWKTWLLAQISLNIFFKTQIIWNDFLVAFLEQFIYLLSRPNGTMQLYQFVIISGVLMLVLAQIPSFHSLRHINLVSLVLCLSYSASATAGSIYIGKQSQRN